MLGLISKTSIDETPSGEKRAESSLRAWLRHAGFSHSREILPDEVMAQLVGQIYRSAWPILNTILGAAALAAFEAGSVPLFQVVLWLSVVFILCTVRFALWATYQESETKIVHATKWADRFSFMLSLTGLAIGSSAVFLLESSTALSNVAIVIAVAGFGAGMAGFYAVDLLAVNAYLVGSLLPVIVVSLWVGGTLQIGGAVMLIILAINLSLTARAVHWAMVRTLMLGDEKTRLARALSAEKIRAETANRSKSDFLATMSHELRTPLNAIIGFSDMIVQETFGPLGSRRYAEYLRDINTSANHLLSLINDILDSAKIEAGRYELREEPIDLDKVANSAVRLVRDRATRKDVALVSALETGTPVLADERAMRQIILNLLVNAVKFTPGQGRVELATFRNPAGETVIEIRDTGIGIPPDELTHVLSEFGRASNAFATGEGGTGLGLSIVRSLVTLHGGVFELASELGIGTRATVRLPASRARTALGDVLEPPPALAAAT